MGKPKRGSAYLYRDRRRRMRRLRYAKWAAVVLAALLALILLVTLLSRQGSRPVPEPTSSPAPVVTPEPTPEPTESPLSGGVRAPMANVATKSELIDLYWWMIETGNDAVLLDALTIDEGDIADITDKFSNYFERYRACFDPPGVKVEFKSGINALVALQGGDTSGLDEDALAVAEAAQAAVEEIITPGMSDWDRELAVHDYVVNHCQYTLDILAPHSGDALGLFKYGEARCAGYCDAFRLLGRLAGLEVEMIGGPTTRDESGSKGHAWNLVKLDGKWYIVDCVWDDLIEEEPTLEHTFFNVTYAAFGSMRRGEICALVPSDFSGNRVRISKSMVRDKDNFWVIKPVPKTDESNRTVVLPPEIMSRIIIPAHGRVVPLHPEQVSNRFRRAVRSCGCETMFRFHDLRHYYVSIAHALGVPDAYIMEMGGWKTDNVMKRVYRDTLPDVMKAEQEKLNAHFGEVFGA